MNTAIEIQPTNQMENATPPALRGQPAFPLLRRTLSNAAAMGAAEACTLMLCLMLGGLVRAWWRGDPMFASWMIYLVVAWVIGAIATRLLPGWGLGPAEELRRTVLLLVVVFGGTVAMLFWGKAAGDTSRLTLTTAFLFSLVLVPFARLQVKRILLARGSWGVPTVIYGDAAAVSRVIEALRDESGLGYQPFGVFSDHLAEAGVKTIADIPVLGHKSQSTRQAPAAIFVLPSLPRHRVTDMLEDAMNTYGKVLIIPDLLDTPSLWVVPRDLVGTLGLEISSNLLDPMARTAKRATDLALVLLALPIWIPLCYLLALLIRLGDGENPLFLQERIGRDGRPFHTWKLRTMHPNAEALLARKLAENAELRKEWETTFKLRNDPRITPIGRLLRRTSLDELPQLINVLKGEMSLVGPRPLPRYHHDELPERVRRLRDRVRPGITGLWQVSGRSESGNVGIAKWDTYYVRNWSSWLDIVILVRTVRAVTSGQGAF
jgi:Undecaprenyl-phosphate galactose phosphotransferase WbaP